MARILIGTFPAAGHNNPFLPLARALVARGHEVLWNSSVVFRKPIEATGARFAPIVHARDYEIASFDHLLPERTAKEGVGKLKYDIKHVFVDNAAGQLRDVQEIMRDFRADIILGDSGYIGGFFYHEMTGVPMAMMNVLPMGLNSHDVAPNGLALAPDASPLGRLRNRALNWAIEHVLFRDVQQHWNAARAQLGLRPIGWIMDAAARAPLYMQPTVPSFEYTRGDLPANVHFIGMMPGAALLDWQPPAWWGELDGARPVIHVTQGTVANSSPTLIAPALAGLAGEDVLVVVTTGGRPVEELGLGQLPDNVRITSYLSYPELLPKTAAMITNGGYGGVQMALAHGVPLAVAGTTEDKPEVAARVAWSGAGINLKTAAPTPT
jgi:MGT family glycosyltransferase